MNDISLAAAERAVANLQARGLVTGYIPGDPNATITKREPMTCTTLKISAKMAALLAELLPATGNTNTKIAAEVAAGRHDAAGAVLIESEHVDTVYLHGFALGSMSKLDAELGKIEGGPEKHKLLGQHSAWRALVRQMPQYPATPTAIR